MQLTHEELKILKLCDEEPNNINMISKETKISENKVKEIVKNLEKKNLIYYDGDINFWCSTVEGVRKLRACRVLSQK